MTKENMKISYDHFVKTGQTKDAEIILKSYPEFKKVKKEEIKPKKEKK